MSSGKRQRQAEMRRRVAQAQAEQRRAQRNQRLVWGAVVLAVIASWVPLPSSWYTHSSLGDSSTATTVRPTTGPPIGRTPCRPGDGTNPARTSFTSAPASSAST